MLPSRTFLLATLLFARALAAQFTQQGPKLVGLNPVGVGLGAALAISGDGSTAIAGGRGMAQIYTWNGQAWIRQGGNLEGTGSPLNFGQSVALSADGNTAIVGGNLGSLAAAWVFARAGGVWAQQGAELVGTDQVIPEYGAWTARVALSSDGDTAILGAPQDGWGLGNIGAVWIFTRSGGVWSQESPKFGNTEGLASVGAGVALSADGNSAIVGGKAAWIYTRAEGVWTMEAKLVGSDSTDLGGSVSLSGDGNTAVVGGPSDDGGVGATWVFGRSGGVWSQQGAKLVGVGGSPTAHEGDSLSLSAGGTTLMVGGYDDSSGTGAVWVFVQSGEDWVQQGDKLTGSDGVGSAQQGSAVSLTADGNFAIVGGPGDDGGLGAVWTYERLGDSWTQKGSKLAGPTVMGEGSQGSSVAVSADGNTAVVGGSGVWVFTREAGGWTEQGSKLVGSGTAAFSETEVAVSADGNTIAVGCRSDANFTGATWVFTRSGSVWTQQGEKLVGTGSVAMYPEEGMSVALSADGGSLLVGGTDGAWVFTGNGGVWTQQGEMLVGTGAIGDAYLGASVSLSADGNTALVGGPGDDSSTGAAWVFTRSGAAWTQEAKLVGSGWLPYLPEQGSSVALSGDGKTAILGGPYDGSGTGAPSTGASWVFRRTGEVWMQEAKLIGSGTSAFSTKQGSSVSLSRDGDTAIVGGPEDDPTGAAWVFTRAGDVWTQQGDKLVGTGVVGGASQGSSVSLSANGNTVIIGGPSDDSSVGAVWVFTTPALPLRLYTLTPCRLVDTRHTPGPLGGPVLETGATRTFPLFAGSCGIPSTAKALSLNVTTTDATAAGYLQIHAADQPMPATSVINFRPGRMRANNAMVAVSSDGTGSISVLDTSAGSVHLILDVSGYFQ